jgi:Fur family ferric uptake transcriptional regulator
MDERSGGQRNLPRQTRQRICVLRVIEDADGPLEIAEILQRAHELMPNLGLATVYRTLRLLQESHQIRSVNLPDGFDRYELADLGPHHFKCRSCQGVYTLPQEVLPLPSQVFQEFGFEIEAQESVFYGRCPKCRSC